MTPAGTLRTRGRIRRPRRSTWAAGLAVLATVATLIFPAPAQATSYVPINGAGSTWAENAFNVWTGDVAQYGMEINYAGTGSSDGRNQYKEGTVDYADSDIPYGESDDGIIDPVPTTVRPFAYVPVVAGGTAFMYHLDVGGRRITDLRLSGETIAKIFTANITMWNDPEIRAENPGIVLPAEQIVPVYRTDGSGSTAQFTAWMAALYPNIWNPYCAKAGRVSDPCGTTSLYPYLSTSDFIGQSLDSGVAGYVAQSTSEGAITYTEYSYAKLAGFPAAKMLNSAGYYTLPTVDNVAVSLTKAVINQDAADPAVYLTENLSHVYTDTDPRTYPLSSYSYMIVPTSTVKGFTDSKGVTLSAFAYYVLCQGQQPMGNQQLGYSPLPINLVQAGFEQILKIPGAVAQSIKVSTCNNPTFSPSGVNTLVARAPYPVACDKAGSTQCAGDGVTAIPAGVSGGSGSTGGGSGTGTGTGSGTGGGTGTGGAKSSKSPGAGGTATSTASGGPVNPDTGQQAGGTGGVGASLNPDVLAVPVSISSTLDSSVGVLLMAAAALFLLSTVFGPALLVRLRKRRKQ
jgi:phosphate ABC transporter phosphate-binding protein